MRKSTGLSHPAPLSPESEVDVTTGKLYKIDLFYARPPEPLFYTLYGMK
jgi:hypothetical protein